MTRNLTQRISYLAGFALLSMMVSTVGARANTLTIFTNFGPGNSFNSFGDSPVDSSIIYAMPFTAAATADLSQAVLALGFPPFGGTNNPVTVDVESNSSGHPGSILATLNQQGTIPSVFASPLPLTTFTYSGPALQLTAGTQYWLMAYYPNSGTAQLWFDSRHSSGTVDVSFSGPTTPFWSPFPGAIAGAFQVDGPTTAAEPGPLTLTLVALGVLGLGAFRKKHKRTVSEKAGLHNPSGV